MFWKRHILSQFFFFLKNFFFLQKNDLNFHPNFATIAYTVEGCSRFFSFHILNIVKFGWMIPHLQVGLHHKLAKKKDTEMCVYLSGEV
jgi:hypothetical protein